MQQYIPLHILERIRQLWAERDRFFTILDRLPAAFSHFDFKRRNLFLHPRADGSDELAAIDWIYNAWGGKYPPWDDDDVVPQKIAPLLGIRLFEPGIVLEGGSIDVNGCGTLLTTTRWLRIVSARRRGHGLLHQASKRLG